MAGKVVILNQEEYDKLSIYDTFLLTVPDDWMQFMTERIKSNVKLLSDTIIKKEIEYVPSKLEIWNAFVMTRWEKTRVVVIGQDSYDTPGFAMGLAFSVTQDLPPRKSYDGKIGAPTRSLDAIFDVYCRTLGYKHPKTGSLVPWALEGVLLLNVGLSVIPHKPGSLVSAWSQVTKPFIQSMSAKKPLIFVLWGKDAQGIKDMIKGDGHIILEGPHPVARDGSFRNVDHFREINQILEKRGEKPINWKLD
jgi:uracil-DNA glycosylase